jgi:uncharacterized protein YndB with AHSA1/START domain/uncharacterized protein YciI
MTPLPPVRRARELGVSGVRAFEALTTEIGAWWPLATHSATQNPAASLEFSGGELVETSPGGHRHVWGRVLRWEPPHGLSMTWHPGRDATPAVSEVELRVTPLAQTRCLVEVLHRGWERLPDPPAARSEYEIGWPAVIARLADHLDEEESPELWHVLVHSPGPRWQSDRSPAEQEGFAQHFAFIQSLDARGLLVAAGPLPATAGKGQTIVRDLDTETATRLANTQDASVSTGLLDVEVIPWLVVSQPTGA